MQVKINWRVLIAVVVIIGALFWAVNTVRPQSYTGMNLNFGIGNGTITVTNHSDTSVPTQLLGSGSRSFSVSSTTEGVSGSSTRAGSGGNFTQVFSLVLPPGVTIFTVAGGTSVKFLANATPRLEVSVQPVNESEARTTLAVAAVVIVAALFYLSHMNGHRWLSASRRKQASDQAAKKLAESQTFKDMFDRVTSDKP
jgi:preprotein translocase subunit SecE